MYRSYAGDMGPVNLLTCHQQILGFAPTALTLTRERNWIQTHRSVSQRAVDCVGSLFFSGAVALLNSVDDT
jgi:hypothetical protein